MQLYNYLDIDECTRGTSGCDHNCTNTDGSYYCTCMDGYEQESDNHTCTGNDYVLMMQSSVALVAFDSSFAVINKQLLHYLDQHA